LSVQVSNNEPYRYWLSTLRSARPPKKHCLTHFYASRNPHSQAQREQRVHDTRLGLWLISSGPFAAFKIPSIAQEIWPCFAMYANVSLRYSSSRLSVSFNVVVGLHADIPLACFRRPERGPSAFVRYEALRTERCGCWGLSR
jgi:hypothetical protein